VKILPPVKFGPPAYKVWRTVNAEERRFLLKESIKTWLSVGPKPSAGAIVRRNGAHHSDLIELRRLVDIPFPEILQKDIFQGSYFKRVKLTEF
jgi:hypothetical protein